MKSTNYLFVLILSNLLFSCILHRTDNRQLIVKNNSDKTIYSILSPDDKIGSSGYYDEFMQDENYDYNKDTNSIQFVFSPIWPNHEEENVDRTILWETYFDKIEDKKLRLYIVPHDSVKKYGWYKIFTQNIYVKKYKLSLEDLEKQNWKIEYNNINSR